MGRVADRPNCVQHASSKHAGIQRAVGQRQASSLPAAGQVPLLGPPSRYGVGALGDGWEARQAREQAWRGVESASIRATGGVMVAWMVMMGADGEFEAKCGTALDYRPPGPLSEPT
jgi:hypothetical protein